MVRDRLGNILEQCSVTYKQEANHVRCVKESGHDGEHEDTRGNWNAATEAEPTTVPDGENGG